MGIRLKILFVFVLGFGVMAGVSLYLLQRSVGESYARIERSDLVANLGRVEQSFAAAATSLRNQAKDWAVWDEMHRYAFAPSSAWARSNIGQDALKPADLSMVLVLGKNGELLTESAVDHGDGRLRVVTPTTRPYLAYISRDTRASDCGMMRLDAGLMLLCWAGILRSDATGEVAGKVVMGRLLDAARIDGLREQTRLHFSLEQSFAESAGMARWPGTLPANAIGRGQLWTASDDDLFRLHYPLHDLLGEPIGAISLELPRVVHKQGQVLYRQVREQIGWTALFVTVLLGTALHFLLIRRLGRLSRQIDELDGETAWDKRITIDGEDELGMVAAHFNRLLALIEAQVAGLNESVAAKEAALTLAQSAQAQLQHSEQSAWEGQRRLANLLNNSGQGFLSFGRDLVIEPDTSLACTAMLGGAPAGRDAAQVFFHNDAEKADLFRSVVSAVIDEADRVIRASMLSLLPTEISRGPLLLKADYKLLENSRFMVILTDVTEERQLEMIVAAVSDTRHFFDATDAFRDFLRRKLPQKLETSPGTLEPRLLATQLYRDIHTYKGLLNQFSFVQTPAALHACESRLAGLRGTDGALRHDAIVDIFAARDLDAAFENDLSQLSEALGDDFLQGAKRIVFTREQAAQLEVLARRLLEGMPIDVSPASTRTLLRELVALRKVTLRSVIANYDRLVQQVARRQEKEVAPITVQGGDELWLDPQPCQEFFLALGHVFRNAVAHGLESPEGRWLAHKDAQGAIACRITLQGTTVRLSISDDGGGLDIDALRRRALDAAVCGADELAAMDDDAVAALVFHEDMTTEDEVTDIAGRGAGLAAVLAETRALHGEISVHSVAGKGTEFCFSIPLRELCREPGSEWIPGALLNADVDRVMRALVRQTRNYFANEFSTGIEARDTTGGKINALTLLGRSVLIDLKGSIGLRAVFSFSEELSEAVHHWMTLGLDTDLDDPAHAAHSIDAALGEAVNAIVGHSLTEVQHLDRRGIAITPPTILAPGNALPARGDTAYFTRHLFSKRGRLDVTLVGAEVVFNTDSSHLE